MLGEFEYLVLSAASRLGDEAYGVTIRQAVEAATKANCSAGSLYTRTRPAEDPHRHGQASHGF